MTIGRKTSSGSENLNDISFKLYNQFKLHFSPILLAKIAKLIHRLKLTPSSSLFFSKLKLYDAKLIQRENVLIIEQNQINRKSQQTLDSKQNNKNNDQKKKQNFIIQKQNSKDKKSQCEKLSVQDFQKISKYIEIMLRRFKDYEEFIFHLKNANISIINQEMQCREQMLRNIHKAKQRISLFNNYKFSSFQNQKVNEKNQKKYYKLSFDRRRPYSTQRIVPKKIQLNNKKYVEIKRFKTQVNQDQEKNRKNDVSVRNSLGFFKKQKKLKENGITSKQNNFPLQNGQKNSQLWLNNSKNILNQKQIGKVKSQNILKFTKQSQIDQIDNQKPQLTCKQFFQIRKSNFFCQALNKLIQQQKQNIQKANNKNKNQKSKNQITQQQCKSKDQLQQQKRSFGLLSHFSSEKNRKSKKSYDFIQQFYQQKNTQSTRNSKRNQQNLNTGKASKLSLNRVFTEQNEEIQKKQYYKEANSNIKKGKKIVKKRIGQITESQTSSIFSSITNLNDKSTKNIRQRSRRKGGRIDGNMQNLFKRLVQDTKVRELVQQQQIKQIQKQNRFNNEKNHSINGKKQKMKTKLTSMQNFIDQQQVNDLNSNKIVLQMPQYVKKTNHQLFDNLDIKEIQRIIQPMNKYNQSKMILKYGSKDIKENGQFRYNHIGHLQFNHEYFLRFNTLQINTERAQTMKRRNRITAEDLKIQMFKTFAKKIKQQDAPLQKSLQICSQYIQ